MKVISVWILLRPVFPFYFKLVGRAFDNSFDVVYIRRKLRLMPQRSWHCNVLAEAAYSKSERVAVQSRLSQRPLIPQATAGFAVGFYISGDPQCEVPQAVVGWPADLLPLRGGEGVRGTRIGPRQARVFRRPQSLGCEVVAYDSLAATTRWALCFCQAHAQRVFGWTGRQRV
jgi:hypothetical protein